MSQPLVSVVIPLHNAEQYIGEAIESINNQTYRSIEIIIVDDGSTDQSLAVAKNFEKDHITILRQENKGASAARNTGLAQAKGKYIQYLDADDLLSPNKIEAQVKLLEANEGYLSLCVTSYFKDGEDPFSKKPEPSWYHHYCCEDTLDFIIKLYGGAFIGPEYGGMVAIHSWLSPKAILDLAGPWNETLSMDDDGEYFCRVIVQAKGICAAEAISFYRKYNNNKSLSAQLSRKGYESMISASILKYNHLLQHIDTPLLQQIFIPAFEQIAIAAYPQYMDISTKGYQMAKKIGLSKVIYKAGPTTTFFSKIFGWKIARRISYLRFGV